MRTILDIGQQGAEQLGALHMPQAESLPVDLDTRLAIIKRFPLQTVEADTLDGIKRSVAVRTLALQNSRVFDLVRSLAPYEPMVYAQSSGRRVFGMLSPNYDQDGWQRLASIKIVPLAQAYPLSTGLLPDARMATMLAGAVNAEGQGIGGHEGNIAEDFEHRATILGAISLNDQTVALGHRNHEVRSSSSVATGLTDGRLGNLYEANGAVSDFPGYGEPLVFDPNHVTSNDLIFFPDSFLDSETAFGATYVDASQIMLGAGMQVLYEQRGRNVSSEIKRLGEGL